MRVPEGEPQGNGTGGVDIAAEGWGAASLKAGVALVVAVVGFMVIPDRLLAYLSLHVRPRVRDTLVSLWFVAFFLALSWTFVAIQRKRGR